MDNEDPNESWNAFSRRVAQKSKERHKRVVRMIVSSMNDLGYDAHTPEETRYNVFEVDGLRFMYSKAEVTSATDFQDGNVKRVNALISDYQDMPLRVLAEKLTAFMATYMESVVRDVRSEDELRESDLRWTSTDYNVVVNIDVDDTDNSLVVVMDLSDEDE